jgi:uncharacterized protein (UPF0276 family)
MSVGHARTPTGVGLGLRSAFAWRVARGDADGRVAFMEIAPENYIHRAGKWPSMLERIAERHPLITHGLTMSLGGLDPFDPYYMEPLKAFTARFGAWWHSDHLCFATHEGTKLHDLLPIPMTHSNARYVAERIKQASALLERPMAIENVSAYLPMGEAEMTEAEFCRNVLELADCPMLLDVNNIWVNSKNFGFDPFEWLETIPLERVVQLHVAGHEDWEEFGMFIDTHGAAVEDKVYDLMAWVIERTGPLPVLLERDTNIPDLDELLDEVGRLRSVYDAALEAGGHALASAASAPEITTDA